MGEELLTEQPLGLRFNSHQDALDFAARAGISEPVAAARLRELVEHGLLERVPYQDPGQRTRDGRSASFDAGRASGPQVTCVIRGVRAVRRQVRWCAAARWAAAVRLSTPSLL